MSRLTKLRERAGKKITPEFDAAMTAMAFMAPAWLLAHGLSGGGWGWAFLVLVCAPLATLLTFVLVGGVLESPLGVQRAELTGFAGMLVASAFWAFSRYQAWGFLPLTVAVVAFVTALVSARRAKAPAEDLPDDVAGLFGALPADLPAEMREPIERALGDHESVQATLKDLADDAAVDAAALRRDLAAALRAMADRARLSARLVDAARGNTRLETAARDARAQIDALAAQVHGALESLLLYAAARQPDGADELRARAGALRAATASLIEIGALEKGS